MRDSQILPLFVSCIYSRTGPKGRPPCIFHFFVVVVEPWGGKKVLIRMGANSG